jgi:hypothetical protein
VAVEVVASAVIAHGGARIGVTGGDLGVAEVDAGVEHRRDERVPEHAQPEGGDCVGTLRPGRTRPASAM